MSQLAHRRVPQVVVRESAVSLPTTPAPLRATRQDSRGEMPSSVLARRSALGNGLCPSQFLLTPQSHGSGTIFQPSFTSLPATSPPLEPLSGRPHQNIVLANGEDARNSQRLIRPFANGEDSTLEFHIKSEYRFSRASRWAPRQPKRSL